MYNNFRAISLSYKNTPIEIRELLALDEETISRLLRYFREFVPVEEIMILSTCNRTEVYFSNKENFPVEDIIKLICIENNINNCEDFFQYFNIISNPREAVKHLFNVAIGLDAQVVGDLQITNQVKRAYQLSADEDLAGPFLHRLMHTIFYTNKRVVQETPFRDGAASVSYAATELIQELTTHIINPKILVIGLGEIGGDVCKNLSNASYTDVTIINRTIIKAENTATSCGFNILPFEDVYDCIGKADVIISSVAGDKFFIDKAFVQKLEIPGYKYFIDLSVPRSVENDVEKIPGVLVYNIDNIKNKTTEALNKRISAIPRVEQIINESIDSFHGWAKEMEVSPTIKKLKNALEKIRQEEIARYLKKLNPEESKKVDKITKNILQKIIKSPVLQLKAACKRGEAETMIDLINDLFDLEQGQEKEKESSV